MRQCIFKRQQIQDNRTTKAQSLPTNMAPRGQQEMLRAFLICLLSTTSQFHAANAMENKNGWLNS